MESSKSTVQKSNFFKRDTADETGDNDWAHSPEKSEIMADHETEQVRIKQEIVSSDDEPGFRSPKKKASKERRTPSAAAKSQQLKVKFNFKRSKMSQNGGKVMKRDSGRNISRTPNSTNKVPRKTKKLTPKQVMTIPIGDQNLLQAKIRKKNFSSVVETTNTPPEEAQPNMSKVGSKHIKVSQTKPARKQHSSNSTGNTTPKSWAISSESPTVIKIKRVPPPTLDECPVKKPRPTSFTCRFCHEVFSSLPDLDQHCRDIHLPSIRTEHAKEKPATHDCHLCGKKFGFTKMKAFEQHVTAHKDLETSGNNNRFGKLPLVCAAPIKIPKETVKSLPRVAKDFTASDKLLASSPTPNTIQERGSTQADIKMDFNLNSLAAIPPFRSVGTPLHTPLKAEVCPPEYCHPSPLALFPNFVSESTPVKLSSTPQKSHLRFTPSTNLLKGNKATISSGEKRFADNMIDKISLKSNFTPEKVGARPPHSLLSHFSTPVKTNLMTRKGDKKNPKESVAMASNMPPTKHCPNVVDSKSPPTKKIQKDQMLLKNESTPSKSGKNVQLSRETVEINFDTGKAVKPNKEPISNEAEHSVLQSRISSPDPNQEIFNGEKKNLSKIVTPGKLQDKIVTPENLQLQDKIATLRKLQDKIVTQEHLQDKIVTPKKLLDKIDTPKHLQDKIVTPDKLKEKLQDKTVPSLAEFVHADNVIMQMGKNDTSKIEQSCHLTNPETYPILGLKFSKFLIYQYHSPGSVCMDEPIIKELDRVLEMAREEMDTEDLKDLNDSDVKTGYLNTTGPMEEENVTVESKSTTDGATSIQEEERTTIGIRCAQEKDVENAVNDAQDFDEDSDRVSEMTREEINSEDSNDSDVKKGNFNCRKQSKNTTNVLMEEENVTLESKTPTDGATNIPEEKSNTIDTSGAQENDVARAAENKSTINDVVCTPGYKNVVFEALFALIENSIASKASTRTIQTRSSSDSEPEGINCNASCTPQKRSSAFSTQDTLGAINKASSTPDNISIKPVRCYFCTVGASCAFRERCEPNPVSCSKKDIKLMQPSCSTDDQNVNNKNSSILNDEKDVVLIPEDRHNTLQDEDVLIPEDIHTSLQTEDVLIPEDSHTILQTEANSNRQFLGDENKKELWTARAEKNSGGMEKFIHDAIITRENMELSEKIVAEKNNSGGMKEFIDDAIITTENMELSEKIVAERNNSGGMEEFIDDAIITRENMELSEKIVAERNNSGGMEDCKDDAIITKNIELSEKVVAESNSSGGGMEVLRDDTIITENIELSENRVSEAVEDDVNEASRPQDTATAVAACTTEKMEVVNEDMSDGNEANEDMNDVDEANEDMSLGNEANEDMSDDNEANEDMSDDNEANEDMSDGNEASLLDQPGVCEFRILAWCPNGVNCTLRHFEVCSKEGRMSLMAGKYSWNKK